MTPVESGLRSIAAILDEHQASWALVGGLAVSARAEPRTTRDVDVVVAIETDVDAERLVNGLRPLGYQLVSAVEQDRVGRLATVRAQREHDSIVDLLFASSGIEREIAAAAERILILPDLTVPVARVGHLMALKLLSRDDRHRPQDFDDLRALLREADDAELRRCREAIRLIETRGFHRGRDLACELEQIVAAGGAV